MSVCIVSFSSRKGGIAGDLMTSEEVAEEINTFAGNRHYFEK